MDLVAVDFSGRLATLMSRGDTAGTGTLARVFCRAHTGAAGPELEHQLVDLAHQLVTALPGLEAVLRALEEDLAAQLDGD